MSRLSNRRERHRAEAELNITTFLNLMVVLIPFLLVTAVFSRITIHELDLPAEAAGQTSNRPAVNIEVMVRRNRLEVGDGRKVLVTIPRNGERYDLRKLSEALLDLKKSHGDREDATILVEPDIDYESVIHVMDAVRVIETREPGTDVVKKTGLFPAISIGDAP
jgi:biopolymer transport protein ExbD